MERESGYYWVREKPHDPCLQVADWTGAVWFLPGDHVAYDDTDFAEIDERPIVREDESHDV